MSTLRVSNIQDTAGSNNSTPAAIANGIAKAWVNFNGTGTTATNQTIRASYNVSSVYKNGTGDYTVNFTTALADANYSVVFGVYNNDVGGSGPNLQAVTRTAQAPTTSAVRVYTGAPSNAAFYDAAGVSVAIFR